MSESNRAMVVLAVLFVVLIVGVSISSLFPHSSSSADGPGPPFSVGAQQEIARQASLLGADVPFNVDTGECAVVLRVYQYLGQLSHLSGTITKANAVAATAPEGSLFETLSSWTNGDEEVLQAVQDCTGYLAGKPW